MVAGGQYFLVHKRGRKQGKGRKAIKSRNAKRASRELYRVVGNYAVGGAKAERGRNRIHRMRRYPNDARKTRTQSAGARHHWLSSSREKRQSSGSWSGDWWHSTAGS